ncbi:Pyruvate formate-lyase 1-activating enzyme [Koleobacter methoxysyntrophicus]|uniref:Pyruvate formate-lyase 1-activating enzyme n=1 Tax=Koleobacter methoxysyntrophicus TaxID=2751313 RepID=A0A8A0RKX5_9FIRM|nr:AmmeMemoRadiSam system radical SAM enzyme [Koleobacter methoxysyntrophicus]QSQ08280.1 Pyruvate formate-lyase 1-activating enzyme [Koleobacter methoxysyntrophicus]
MKEALFWETAEDGRVKCFLCPHNCLISEGKSGFCRQRKNVKGKLYTLNYGRVSSYGVDPIEKKPLYHFYPGSLIFSLGTLGCNFRCRFCQNWQIAQVEDGPAVGITPERAAELARSFKGNIGIAYTYSEPLIWYEYVLETARLAKQKGLKNVLVTNGFVNEKPLKDLLPYIDAMNIDVKGFTREFYKEYIKGDLSPVIETVERASKECHVEITTLLIPGLNDSEEDIRALSRWLGSLKRDIPLHLTRYFPNYKMDLPPTPVETMKKAREIAAAELDYVYLGNIRNEGNNTYCPRCRTLLIERTGTVKFQGLSQNGKCSNCGREINIVM